MDKDIETELDKILLPKENKEDISEELIPIILESIIDLIDAFLS